MAPTDTPALTDVSVTLTVPEGMTEQNWQGRPFMPAKVTHRAYIYEGEFFHRTVVIGDAADRAGLNTSYDHDFPEHREAAARYPAPPPWFHIALASVAANAQVTA